MGKSVIRAAVCVSLLLAVGCDEEETGGGTAAPMGGEAVGDAGAGAAADATVDEGPDACVPVAEECNGVDDDCDGLGDESLMPPPADRTEGICGLFFKQCTGPDGWQEPNYRVSPEYQDEEDRCDGQDNDCDGTVDENLSPPPASLTVGVCEDALQECTGVLCFDDPDYTAIENYEAQEMTCDGLDNDCDGSVDERLAGCMP